MLAELKLKMTFLGHYCRHPWGSLLLQRNQPPNISDTDWLKVA